MTGNNASIKGFRVFWLRYEEQSSDKHQLFAKEHSVRKQEPEYPKGHTLFVLNIPPYATTTSLKSAFADVCGPVRSVTLTTRPDQPQRGFKIGYVVFERESGLDKALELKASQVLTLQTEKNPVCFTGIIKWCKQYNDSLCDEKTVRKEIDDYMHNYDKRIADRLEEEKAGEEVEEDGWTTVSGKKKRGSRALQRTESAIGKIQRKQEESNRKKQLLNFYTFQIRESKKQNLAELRKKFELDKNKLQQLKLKRTFKPF